MLHLKGVEHVYPNGTRALDGVTISIGKGMFGLLGPNGAGKSSLMRTIATLQTPTAGDIKFGDIDVLAEPGRLRATLGYLPQDFGVYPRVSAYDRWRRWSSALHVRTLPGAAPLAASIQTMVCLVGGRWSDALRHKVAASDICGAMVMDPTPSWSAERTGARGRLAARRVRSDVPIVSPA
ncbi:MAG: ATP-binding cassette domain-containing protein [Gemmatimonadaceae bacterium]